MSWTRIFFQVALATLSVASCDAPTPPGRPALVSLAVDSVTLRIDEERPLSLSVIDGAGRPGAAISQIRWVSRDPSIVTVDDAGGLTARGQGITVVVASAAGGSDSAAVRVTGLAGGLVTDLVLTPDSVDTTNGPVTVQVSARLHSSAPPNAKVILELIPRGERRYSHYSLLGKREADGSHSFGEVTLPAGMPRGTLDVWNVAVFEGDFYRTVGLSELAEAGLEHQVRITGREPDTRPPVIHEVGLSPTRVVVDAADAYITVNVRVEEGGSGVRQVYATLGRPGGGDTVGCQEARRVSGTSRAGVWQCQVTIPRFGRAGQWWMRTVVTDSAWNEAQAGSPLFVESGLEDRNAPHLSDLEMNPDTVGPRQDVDFVFRVRDQSGTERPSLWIRTGGVFPPGPICALSLVSGTPTDGLWRCRFWTPQVTAPTRIDIVGLTASDRFGNAVSLDEATLSALGESFFVIVP